MTNPNWYMSIEVRCNFLVVTAPSCWKMKPPDISFSMIGIRKIMSRQTIPVIDFSVKKKESKTFVELIAQNTFILCLSLSCSRMVFSDPQILTLCLFILPFRWKVASWLKTKKSSPLSMRFTTLLQNSRRLLKSSDFKNRSNCNLYGLNLRRLRRIFKIVDFRIFSSKLIMVIQLAHDGDFKELLTNISPTTSTVSSETAGLKIQISRLQKLKQLQFVRFEFQMFMQDFWNCWFWNFQLQTSSW